MVPLRRGTKVEQVSTRQVADQNPGFWTFPVFQSKGMSKIILGKVTLVSPDAAQARSKSAIQAGYLFQNGRVYINRLSLSSPKKIQYRELILLRCKVLI
jgi:hypothetical protein